MKKNLLLATVILCFLTINMKAQWNGFNPLWTNSDVGIGLSTPERQLHLKLSDCNITFGEESFFARMKNPFRITRDGGGDIVMDGSPPFMLPRMINCKHINWDLNVDVADANLTQTFNVNGNDQYGNPIDENFFSFGLAENKSLRNFRVVGDFEVTGNTILPTATITNLTVSNFVASNAQINGNLTTNGTNTTNGNIVINNGYLLITGNNTSTTGTNEIKLLSNGYIRAREIKVDYASIPDYVFKNGYKLMPIYELEKFIELNKHLPNIKGENEYTHEEGLGIGELNTKLLEKVEELTLYTIQQQKEIDELKKIVTSLVKR